MAAKPEFRRFNIHISSRTGAEVVGCLCNKHQGELPAAGLIEVPSSLSSADRIFFRALDSPQEQVPQAPQWCGVPAVNSDQHRACLVIPSAPPAADASSSETGLKSWEVIPLAKVLSLTRADPALVSRGNSGPARLSSWGNTSSVDLRSLSLKSVLDMDDEVGDMGDELTGEDEEKRLVKLYGERRRRMLDDARSTLDPSGEWRQSKDGSDDQDDDTHVPAARKGSRFISSFRTPPPTGQAVPTGDGAADKRRRDPAQGDEKDEPLRQAPRTESTQGAPAATTTTSMPPPATDGVPLPSRVELSEQLSSNSAVQQLFAAGSGVQLDAVVKIVLPLLSATAAVKKRSRDEQKLFVQTAKRMMSEILRSSGFAISDTEVITRQSAK